MNDKRPNVLLLMTDQHRGDCLGIEGHPVLQTPYLDQIGSHGFHFRKAYTACPVCVPARRTLMTGQKPFSHGVFMNYHTHLEGPTLPGELSKAGYQTHLCGKLHLWPFRKLYGFDSADWADSATERSARQDGIYSDYDRFLDHEGITRIRRAGTSHGMNGNGYPARPYNMDEHLHFTNWATNNALNFLERRDPTVPFFLKVSYIQPHQPLIPPQCYWDRYINMDLPKPKVGDWAKVYDEPVRGLDVAPWRVCFDDAVQKQMQAGYYGCINHIDNQIGRILEILPGNTIIIFTSDHGEMLGDHQWIRKRNAHEPSARIPFLVRLPNEMGIQQRRKIDAVVELMDIMPTVLDAAGIEIPDTVDGKSLLPLMKGEEDSVREYLHGECSQVPTLNSGMQYLTDGKQKYIYYPGTGDEQLFDLLNDPCEMTNLAVKSDYSNDLEMWRQRLIDELRDRPEGFTDGKRLTPIGGDSPHCLDSAKR